MWEPYDPLSHFAHVVLGFGAYAAGLVALLSTKGSMQHIRAGRVFAVAMAIPVVTAFVFLRQTFFPLVVVLAVGRAT